MFGKKKKLFGGNGPQTPAADDGMSRVFPKEIFEGETGDMLRELGFHPDSPGNILDNQGPARGHLDAHYAEFDQQWATANANLPFDIAPVYLLPKDIWERGDLSWFLTQKLNLWPCRPWNMIFLPVDADGRRQTGLPEYFSVPEARDMQQAVMLLTEVKKSFGGQGDNISEVTMTLADTVAGNFPQLFPADHPTYSPQQQKARRRIRSIAVMIASMAFDKNIILASQHLFLAKPDEQLIA